ncbi:MAG: hypothetical protein ACKOCM_11195 [Cyanobacteriota bacterium]
MTPISPTRLCRFTQPLGLLGVLIGITALMPLAPARAGMVENMILSKCGDAMNADFKKAGQTPPAGMVNDTCNCVLTGWKQKQGLEQSIKTCSAAASAKYGLASPGKSNEAATSK